LEATHELGMQSYDDKATAKLKEAEMALAELDFPQLQMSNYNPNVLQKLLYSQQLVIKLIV
jgi:hypothetical protein